MLLNQNIIAILMFVVSIHANITNCFGPPEPHLTGGKRGQLPRGGKFYGV